MIMVRKTPISVICLKLSHIFRYFFFVRDELEQNINTVWESGGPDESQLPLPGVTTALFWF